MKSSTGSIDERAAEFVFELAAPGPVSAALERQLAEWLSISSAHETAFLEATEAFDRMCLVDPEQRIDVQALLARNTATVHQLAPAEETNSAASHEQAAEDHSAPTSNTRAPGRFSRFLAALAGYDLDLVQAYAGPDAEHERKRLVRMGIAVIIPAFLGLFTAFFVLGGLVEVVSTRIVMAVMASLFILVVDSILVATLSKHGGVGTIIRLLISACMGIVIAEPLLISLYQKSIDAHISMTLSQEEAQRRRAYDYQLSRDDAEYERYQALLAHDIQKLATFEPAALAARHAREREQERDELVKNLRAHRDEEIAQLFQQRGVFEKSREKTQGEIESMLVGLEQEKDGKRASGKAGRGRVFMTLQKDLDSRRADLSKLDDLILAVDSKIEAARRNTADEDRLNARYAAMTVSSDLSPEDRLMKRQLEADVATHQASLAAVRSHQDEVRKAIGRLPEEFALSTRNDSLSQTQALYEILQQNSYPQIKVAALFLLLFLIDIAPVVIKLTVVTDYDRHLRKLQTERYARETASEERDMVSTHLLASHARRIEFLNTFSVRISEGMAAADVTKVNAKRIKAISEKLARAVEQQVDETLLEAEYIQGSYGRPGMFVSLIAALKTCWYVFKTKCGA